MSKEDSSRKETQGGQQHPRLTVFQANPGNSENRQEQQDGETKVKDDEERMRQTVQQFYNFVFRGKAAVWTAIFTCVLAVFSYLLWQVSDSANRLAIATEAATLSSAGPGIIKQANPDGKTLKGWTIAFTWIN